MQRAPLLAPAGALLFAVVAEQHGWTWFALAASALTAVAACCLGKGWRVRTAIALAVGILSGVALSAVRGHPPTLDTERATARYRATVIGDVRENDSGFVSTALALDGIGVVRAAIREHVQPGERVVVRGRLEPFDEPRNPGEPSLREIERDDGYAGRLARATLLARAPPDPWDTRAWGARLRARASARVRSVIPEPSATILAGALWGERGTLPDDLHDAFQATGTVHLLVTAGLHLGIMAAMLAFGLSFAGIHRTPACAVAMVAIIAYAWFSGAHLPSERAATMIGIALLARASGARITSWNALAVAAIVVAILWPASVGSASFALSFSCLAAIILFAEPITHQLRRIAMHERLREALALTCATQIGTWPLTAAVFSTLAPFAILANAVVVPMMAIVIPLGLATLALPGIAPLETLCLIGIQRIVEGIASLPGAHATLAEPPLILVVAYDALAIAAAILMRRGRLRLAATIFVGACAVIVLPAVIPWPQDLRITHLDVGQADAAVIQTPNGHVIIIDTGGELEHGGGAVSNAERAGARIVLAYLRRAGITRIDLMILTHPHGDHVGACRPILDTMPVRMLYDSGQTYSGRAYRDCIASAHAHHVPIVTARRGMQWSSGDGVTLDILAPWLPFLVDTGDDVNENSIVTMLNYRGFRELFMGDAGESSEARLLASGVNLRADVLKVGHHGSQYASTPLFIDAVDPPAAVISVGRHNTFGHPGPATLATLERTGAAAYRTDLCGAITISVPHTISTMFECRFALQGAHKPAPH